MPHPAGREYRSVDGRRAPYNTQNATPATSVGAIAAASSPSWFTASSLKLPFRMDTPAGLGVLAMMVRPPPVTAPATRAYLKSV